MSVVPLVITTPSKTVAYPAGIEDEDAMVGLSLTSRGYTVEDLDPTPVPTGCPRCWEGPGALKHRCVRCPGTRAT